MAAPEQNSNRLELTVSNRTVLRLVGILLATAIVVDVAWRVRDILLLVTVAMFVALVLNPLVGWTERRLHASRLVATLLVVAVMAVIAAIFLGIILSAVYSEVRQLADRFPGYLSELQHSRFIHDLNSRYDLIGKAQTYAKKLPGYLPTTANSLLGVAGAVFGIVANTVLVFFLSIFLLLELPTLARSIQSLLSPPAARRAETIAVESNRAVSRYVAGAFGIAIGAGLITWIALTLLGVPFAFVLGLLVALLDLIPLVGASLGGAISVVVALAVGWQQGLIMLIVVIVYQQVENHVILPVIQRRTVAVSPFIVIVSVAMGATLLGIVGALLAIPVAGIIQIALREWVELRRRTVATQWELEQAAADQLAASGETPPDDAVSAATPT